MSTIDSGQNKRDQMSVSDKKVLDLTNSNDLMLFLNSIERNVGKILLHFKSEESLPIESRLIYRDILKKRDWLRKTPERIQSLMISQKKVSDEFIDHVQYEYNELLSLCNQFFNQLGSPATGSITVKKDVVKKVSSLERRENRKTMLIKPFDKDQNIPISLSVNLEKRLEFKNKINKEKEVSVLVEKKDVINSIVPNKKNKIFKSAKIHNKTSLVDEYLMKDERFRLFLESAYDSPAVFERFMDINITKLENETIDSIERWLGEYKKSAFVFLKNVTVTNIKEMSNSKTIKSDLYNEGIKYETFVMWVDLIYDMEHLIEINPDMTLGELYARWMCELKMTNSLNDN